MASCGGKSEPHKQPEPDMRCEAQHCGGEGYCDMVLSDNPRWIWNGKACVKFYASGCNLAGPHCSALFVSKGDCVASYASCAGVILPTRF